MRCECHDTSGVCVSPTRHALHPEEQKGPFMRLRRAIALGAAAIAAATGIIAGPASVAQAAPAPALAAVTLANTIKLSNCSAALVRFPSSVSTDRAMMLTNGHCYE